MYVTGNKNTNNSLFDRKKERGFKQVQNYAISFSILKIINTKNALRLFYTPCMYRVPGCVSVQPLTCQWSKIALAKGVKIMHQHAFIFCYV